MHLEIVYIKVIRTNVIHGRMRCQCPLSSRKRTVRFERMLLAFRRCSRKPRRLNKRSPQLPNCCASASQLVNWHLWILNAWGFQDSLGYFEMIPRFSRFVRKHTDNGMRNGMPNLDRQSPESRKQRRHTRIDGNHLPGLRSRRRLILIMAHLIHAINRSDVAWISERAGRKQQNADIHILSLGILDVIRP